MIYSYEINNRFPHDPNACCQGLLFHEGRTFESVGDIGKSQLREVDLTTGDIIRRHSLPDDEWAEGITYLDGKLFQITWEHQKAYLYDFESLELQGTNTYSGSGWGLTTDGDSIIQSNGTSVLTFRSAQTFQTIRELHVTWNEMPVADLNDLQFYQGRLLANIWFSTDIAIIDLDSGQITDWIDLSELTKQQTNSTTPALNGIMYDPDNDRLFVTGKFWRDIYEIKLIPAPSRDPSKRPSQRIGLK